MDDVSSNLNDIPNKGKTKLPIWSDDYWRIKFGITSYRYQEELEYDTYKKAVAAYEQPSEFRALVKELDATALVKAIAKLSPAEKYDLTVGDAKFSMTNEQMAMWNRGWGFAMVGPPPPSWFRNPSRL